MSSFTVLVLALVLTLLAQVWLSHSRPVRGVPATGQPALRRGYARRTLLNVSERSARQALVAALPAAYQVLPCVRVLDFVEVPPAMKLRLMGHVDLLVVDEGFAPVLVVEVDGPFHETPEQRRRDAAKDHALSMAGIPVVRVPAQGQRTGQGLYRWVRPHLPR